MYSIVDSAPRPSNLTLDGNEDPKPDTKQRVGVISAAPGQGILSRKVSPGNPDLPQFIDFVKATQESGIWRHEELVLWLVQESVTLGFVEQLRDVGSVFERLSVDQVNKFYCEMSLHYVQAGQIELAKEFAELGHADQWHKLNIIKAYFKKGQFEDANAYMRTYMTKHDFDEVHRVLVKAVALVNNGKFEYLHQATAHLRKEEGVEFGVAWDTTGFHMYYEALARITHDMGLCEQFEKYSSFLRKGEKLRILSRSGYYWGVSDRMTETVARLSEQEGFVFNPNNEALFHNAVNKKEPFKDAVRYYSLCTQKEQDEIFGKLLGYASLCGEEEFLKKNFVRHLEMFLDDMTNIHPSVQSMIGLRRSTHTRDRRKFIFRVSIEDGKFHGWGARNFDEMNSPQIVQEARRKVALKKFFIKHLEQVLTNYAEGGRVTIAQQLLQSVIDAEICTEEELTSLYFWFLIGAAQCGDASAVCEFLDKLELERKANVVCFLAQSGRLQDAEAIAFSILQELEHSWRSYTKEKNKVRRAFLEIGEVALKAGDVGTALRQVANLEGTKHLHYLYHYICRYYFEQAIETYNAELLVKATGYKQMSDAVPGYF